MSLNDKTSRGLKAYVALSLTWVLSMSLNAMVMPRWGAIGDDASANACVVRGDGQPPVRYGDLIRKGSVDGELSTIRS